MSTHKKMLLSVIVMLSVVLEIAGEGPGLQNRPSKRGGSAVYLLAR